MSSLPSQPFVPAARAPFLQRRGTRRTIFFVLILLLLAIVATFIAAINLRRDLQTSLPQLDGTLPIAGLTAAVTVTRDPHGVPSIHASTLDDLLFAQGYITASDRLFQMDALRRHGAGELAELLGSSLLDHDKRQRYLQLRASATRAIAVLPPDQLHQLQVYADGVNAFIAAAERHSPSAQDLQVEFHLLHYTPRPWLPRDSLLISLVMAQDLATRFPAKLNREALATHLPVALLPDLYPVGSWRDHPPTQTPTDLTTPTDSIDQIPLDRSQSRIELCHTTGCPVHTTLPSSNERASQNSPWPTATTQDLLAVSNALRSALCDGCRFGSNNWAVAGTHSATGAPLLSNDMHLGLTAPDIWYEAALHADGSSPLDVTGFTLPGIPFVVVGRNPFIAWGFTNSGADVQDVLIEHLRGHGPQTEFEHPDGSWSPVQHQTETIHVRASRDITLDVLLTTHALGDKSIPTPIISPLYPTERRALALAWTIYDASTITSPLYEMNTATDAASLVAAAANFASVSQNLVYADAHHIGYHLLGRIPVRGPAIQRPRPAAPFILPDNTPPEDDEDESGSLALPSSNPDSTNPSATNLSAANTRVPQGFSLGPYRLMEEVSFVARGFSPARQNSHAPKVPPQQSDTDTTTIPTAPTTPYTIGSPISSVPIDALDQSQVWSGYIPYDQLPSVLDPTSGLIATANARIAPDNYPYFIANDWVDAYRVERIYTLLQNRSGLTPADMLAIQTDTRSDLDLLVAQRVAYALDHAALTQSDPRLRQAADLLRNFDSNMAPNSSAAAAIVAATREQLWPMLLAPQLRPAHFRDTDAPKPHKLSPIDISDLLDLYTWDEKTTALEQLLQHTPARWLPRKYATWNDFLAAAVQRSLRSAGAPTDLATWTYGTSPVDQSPTPSSAAPVSSAISSASPPAPAFTPTAATARPSSRPASTSAPPSASPPTSPTPKTPTPTSPPANPATPPALGSSTSSPSG